MSLDPQRSTTCAPVTAGLRVLIIDDDAINRKLLRTVLEVEGHSVLESDNGINALKVLERSTVDRIVIDDENP